MVNASEKTKENLMIVIVFGLPGSGKSCFSRQFAALINAEHISSDLVRKEMLNSRTYCDDEKAMVYHEMLVRAKDLLERHKNAVIDATFYRNKFRKQWMRALPGSIFIELRADESVIKRRLQQKRSDSEADYEVFSRIKAQWEPMADDHLTLQSTDNNINDLLQQASSYFLLHHDQ